MKLILAPMATLSHEALRLLLNSFGGWDEYYTEMINASSYLAGGQFEHWYVRQAPCPQKIVWQITGNNASKMAQTALLLAEKGGIGIDINMGCCAPEIVRTGAGFAWMTKPIDETAELVKAVRNSCGNMRLSVKLRLGPDECYERLLAFTRMLVDNGVELITLHPRTGKEKLKHTARWNFVRQLSEDLSIPVYGNGDIETLEDIANRSTYTSAGLMIGRAAVQKPWIAAIAKGATIPPVDIRQLGLTFIEYLQQSQPPEFYKSRAHRFFFYFCDNLTFGHRLKMNIQNMTTLQEITASWIAYFEKVPSDILKNV